MVRGLWTSVQRHTDGFALLKAIRNWFCNMEKHNDSMAYFGFIVHVRVHILSKISRLNSEKYCCVSRKNMIRKFYTVKHLGKISDNLYHPLSLRPIPADAMVSSTIKWEITLHDYYYPMWIRCSGLCCGNKQPPNLKHLPPKCISHLCSVSQVQGSLLCAVPEVQHLINCTTQNTFSWAPSTFCSGTNTHHFCPVHWLQLTYWQGSGKITVAITALLLLYFMILWFCWECYLAYSLMLSTVNTSWMWSPQKLT